MSDHIDKFQQDLHRKLQNIEHGLHDLKAQVDAKAQDAEKDVRVHLEKVKKRIEHNHAKLAAAQGEAKSWFDEEKAATADHIADWKARRETDKLHRRADRAERYAEAAVELAAAAVDEAERAALDAWLAREDASSAQVKQA